MTDTPREWIDTARIAFETALAEETGEDMSEIIVTAEDRVSQQIIFAKVIAALRPLIEAETRERCAGIAEKFAKTSEDTLVDLFDFTTRNRIESRMLEARSIASAIRAEGK